MNSAMSPRRPGAAGTLPFSSRTTTLHTIVDKLHAAGIEERDEHGERAGRKPGQLGTYFREPSGFRLQITNEDSATFAAHAND